MGSAHNPLNKGAVGQNTDAPAADAVHPCPRCPGRPSDKYGYRYERLRNLQTIARDAELREGLIRLTRGIVLPALIGVVVVLALVVVLVALTLHGTGADWLFVAKLIGSGTVVTAVLGILGQAVMRRRSRQRQPDSGRSGPLRAVNAGCSHEDTPEPEAESERGDVA